MEAFSTEIYRAIFEASPDGVVVVDGRGVIRQVNSALEHLFGYGRQELEGKPVEVLVPDTLRGAHHQHRGRYASDPHPRPMGIGMELRGRRMDGSEFPVEISLSPLATAGEPLVIASVRDVTQRKRLRDFSAGALRASEEERQRIARELHDDTAQRLATLMVRLRLLERAADEVTREEQVDELRKELQEAADGVRRIARGLRPPELEDAGVAMALRAHARSLQEASGLLVEMEVENVDDVLAPDAKLVLYRIIQEALSNVLRHSGAERARVVVRREDEHVVAVVEDRGRGFREVAARDGGGGLGLIGMQERAVMIGGQVGIESRPGEGTRVRVQIPVDFVEEVQRV